MTPEFLLWGTEYLDRYMLISVRNPEEKKCIFRGVEQKEILVLTL